MPNEASFTVNVRILKSFAKHIAPKKDIRYYLNSVCIQAAPDGLYYIATDGHCMVVAREDYAEGDTAPDTVAEYILPRDLLARMRLGKFDMAVLRVSGEDFQIHALPDGIGGDKLIEAKFPDWRHVVPKECSGELAQFNSTLVSRVADCADDAFGCSPQFLHFRPNGNSAGVVCNPAYPFIGIVMPMRSPCEFEIPAWIAQSPAVEQREAA